MALVGIISIMLPCTLKNCVSEVMGWVCAATLLGHSAPWKVPGKHRLKLKLMEFCHCLRWSQVSSPGVREVLFPPSSSSATGTGCMLSLSHACHKYSSTNLVTSKLNYCNTLLAELRARLLSTACSEHGSTCAQPCEPAGTHHTTLHSPRCQPPKCQVDFKLALLDFKALNNKGSGYDWSPSLWALP